MRFEFVTKNGSVSEAVKQRIVDKLSRLGRLLPDDSVAYVMLSTLRQDSILEVTIPLKRRTLRTQVMHEDILSAADQAVSILDKQMLRYKERLVSRKRRDKRFDEEFQDVFANDSLSQDTAVIERTKRFALKPMDADEAVMEMELLGHDFYVFRNSSSDDINVVYKRKSGSYGLIEPEA